MIAPKRIKIQPHLTHKSPTRYAVRSPITPSRHPPALPPAARPDDARPGTRLRALLNCSGCSSDRIVNMMNKNGAEWCLEERNRNYIIHYIKSRWASQISALRSKGTLTSNDPYTEIIDLALGVSGKEVQNTLAASVTARKRAKPQIWAVGVTTVPSRKDDLLPRTLTSITNGGFPTPHMFVDDCHPKLHPEYFDKFGPDITFRYPKVNGYANWLLGMTELFLRHPEATRFVIFQDDIVLSLNVRQYLDVALADFPQKGFVNLSTIWENEQLVKVGKQGFNPSVKKNNNHTCRGAMGLVFDRDSLLILLRHPHMTDRILPNQRDPSRYLRFIDGAVAEAMNNRGYTEYVHIPCLIQHNGPVSTLTNKTWGNAALARSWLGENWDALSILSEKTL